MAQSYPKIEDKEAILAIIGEVGPYGKEGMQWVASSIRNRKSLFGVYGRYSINILKKKYTKKQYKEATEAWEESKTKDFSEGSTYWFSDQDLNLSFVKEMILDEKLRFIKRVGHNNFYKKEKYGKSIR